MLARLLLAWFLCLGGFALAPSVHAQTAMSQDERDIRALVVDMEAAWNHGDFRGYMNAFERPGVVFVSGGRIQDGW